MIHYFNSHNSAHIQNLASLTRPFLDGCEDEANCCISHSQTLSQRVEHHSLVPDVVLERAGRTVKTGQGNFSFSLSKLIRLHMFSSGSLHKTQAQSVFSREQLMQFAKVKCQQFISHVISYCKNFLQAWLAPFSTKLSYWDGRKPSHMLVP